MNVNGEWLTIIPARGGSKGLPGKNIRLLHGKPLIAYSIEASLKSKYRSEVIVSTDSVEIAEVSKSFGAQVPFMRPSHLSGDEAKTVDVLKHAVECYEQHLGKELSYVMLLQPTSPLRLSTDIDQAVEQFISCEADSLQSVCPAEVHPYLLRTFEDDQLLPYIQDQPHLRRQDLKEMYALNGAIYIVKRKVLMEEDKLVGQSNTGYIMPRERSIDIDDLLDFEMAEFLLQRPSNLR